MQNAEPSFSNAKTYEERYKEFEQYLTFGETGVEERARNWSMAIGLQDVDRLKPSDFLLEQTMNINISYI